MDTGIEMNVGEVNLKNILEDAICKGCDSRPSRRMGASSLGNPCKRATWLKFHWATHELNDATSETRFLIGDIVEDVVVDLLKKSGMEISYTGDEQLELEIAPHIVCYPDGIIMKGVPTAEAKIHTLEIKSMGSRYFSILKKKGVKDARPSHYAQVQLEMYGASKKLGKKVERALYVAVNKDLNTLDVYAERIRYDQEEVNRLLDIADSIRESTTLPVGISTSPTWEACRSCMYSHFCHVSHESLMVNCRTCCHSTPESDGTWSCALDKKYNWGVGALDMGMQMNGCRYHTFNPSLVPYPFHEDMSSEDACAFEMPDGSIVLDGLGGLDSHDLWKTGRPQPVDSEGNPLESIPF